jgi:hypothetical protein
MVASESLWRMLGRRQLTRTWGCEARGLGFGVLWRVLAQIEARKAVLRACARALRVIGRPVFDCVGTDGRLARSRSRGR